MTISQSQSLAKNLSINFTTTRLPFSTCFEKKVLKSPLKFYESFIIHLFSSNWSVPKGKSSKFWFFTPFQSGQLIAHYLWLGVVSPLFSVRGSCYLTFQPQHWNGSYYFPFQCWGWLPPFWGLGGFLAPFWGRGVGGFLSPFFWGGVRVCIFSIKNALHFSLNIFLLFLCCLYFWYFFFILIIIYHSIYRSVCLSIILSIYVPIYLSANLSITICTYR